MCWRLCSWWYRISIHHGGGNGSWSGPADEEHSLRAWLLPGRRRPTSPHDSQWAFPLLWVVPLPGAWFLAAHGYRSSNKWLDYTWWERWLFWDTRDVCNLFGMEFWFNEICVTFSLSYHYCSVVFFSIATTLLSQVDPPSPIESGCLRLHDWLCRPEAVRKRKQM